MTDKEAQEGRDVIDENELAKIGYKQELKRDLSLLQVCEMYLLYTSSSSLPNPELWVRGVPRSELLSMKQRSQGIIQYH